MQTVRIALILIVLAAAGLVAAKQTLVAGQSEIAYVSKQMGVDVEGNFGRFEAQIDLDPDKLPTSSVMLSVDTSSVIFPATDVVAELRKPDWFDTAHYPRAEFKSSRITRLADGRYEITGMLTIKGRTRQVVFPVTLGRSGATTFATGALTIKRLDYGVGGGEWGDTSLVADEVQVKFKIAISGVAPG
jgi:polyisoprenoid-binding protein YceI